MSEDLVYEPKPHLLAFINALGFWNESRGKSARINAFFETIKNEAEQSASDSIDFKTIGDSVILTSSAEGVESSDNGGTFWKASNGAAYKSKLQRLINLICKLQCSLATQDIWIRGAITYGPLHVSNWQIIGPAFDEAYRLEANVAKFPRVIVDGRVLKAGTWLNAKESGISNLYTFPYSSRPFALAQDVPTFVDYAEYNILDKNTNFYFTFLETCSHLVANRLRDDVTHYSKHRWSADYLVNKFEDYLPHGRIETDAQHDFYSRLKG